MTQRFTAALTLILIAATCTSTRADWPMWGGDPARSHATSESVVADPGQRWIVELPPPVPAWPASQTKLRFDAGYEPVVAAGRMLVASSANDSVSCYDVKTGDQVWQFFTEGPVRFAPAVADGRVFVVSDDGRLYCLDLADGGLTWSVDGGPMPRSIIGNARLISTWPARGGVVVADGVAYFACGIWPSMGVFIHAVDVRDGSIIWTNSETSSVFITHPHGADSFGSISPQGYLAVSDDALIVPGGRTLPGVFDRATGRLRHFDFGGKGSGGYRVLTTPRFCVVGTEMFQLSDGTRLATLSGLSVSGSRLVGLEGRNTLVVSSLDAPVLKKTSKDRKGKERTIVSFKPASSKKVKLDQAISACIQAGETVWVGGEGFVRAYPVQGETIAASPRWQHEVSGRVTSLVAADGNLFVATDAARVYCFGRDEDSGPRGEALAGTPSPNNARGSFPVVADARDVIRSTGTPNGYAVCLGADSEKWVGSLLENSRYKLLYIDDDVDRVDRLRRRADASGHYGQRLSARVRQTDRLDLPPYLATMILCGDPQRWAGDGLGDLFAALRPYGGVAFLLSDEAEFQRIRSEAAASKLENAQVTREGQWTLVRRSGPLPGAGVWSHQYGDASNSSVSLDQRVKAPLGVLWFGGPSNDKVLPRHGHGPAPQVAGGRLFIEGPDMLRCVDVYTGRVWWERDLPGLGAYYDYTGHQPGAGEIGSNYVSLDDFVYVIHKGELLQLDATTGETTHTFELQRDGSAASWSALSVSGDVLLATANPVSLDGLHPTPRDVVPDGQVTLIAPHTEWQYLADSDPPEDWAKIGFDASEWEIGEAGFGFGDDDDRTVLKNMQGKFARVYARQEFVFDPDAASTDLTLMINFDDGFIAYLNGHEVARANIKEGHGADAKDVRSHEAEGFESFALAKADEYVREGVNVLAIEGHNTDLKSNDFTLDPILYAGPSDTNSQPRARLADTYSSRDYSTSSRTLAAFDRHTGARLWVRQADYNFRHNAICAGGGRVYCIDGMSPSKLKHLRRRGIVPAQKPSLLALDAATGKLLWRDDETAFGTFLSYSAEHDVVLQGGSAYRDRATDEVGRGLAAHRGVDGDRLWHRPELKYSGPCLLLHERVFTNGAGGFELKLLTGEQTGWKYKRMYGCNTAIGSEHLLTFRSGSAGFFDLSGDSGTGNLGGFRSSCTSNLVVADGVLNAPDYTRTCVCAYQLQTSLAFVNMPEAESWTFNDPDVPLSSERAALNLGAPGDRRDDDETLWLEYPVIGGPSPRITVDATPEKPEYFTQHSSMLPPGELTWVAASGARGLHTLKWKHGIRSDAPCTVRLVFAEPDDVPAGGRLFDVSLQGRKVLSRFDIAAAREEGAVVIRDVPLETAGEELQVTLTPIKGEPVLCGVSITTRDK